MLRHSEDLFKNGLKGCPGKGVAPLVFGSCCLSFFGAVETPRSILCPRVSCVCVCVRKRTGTLNPKPGKRGGGGGGFYR